MVKNNRMEPIKAIAGRILLYFYSIQRDDYSCLHDLLLSFQMRHFKSSEKSPVLESKESKISENLIKIAGNDNNIYNALMYLYEKGFIDMSKDQNNVSDSLLNFSFTSRVIDIIEGVEREAEERNNFYITFNIKLADDIKIESLIKA